MLPGAVVVGAAGGGGGAPGHVRAAARATLIPGLAVAAMGLFFAATVNPGDFHAQVEHAAAPAAYGGQPQQRCEATEAEALDLRATALVLVLTGAAQAMLAAAAGVALAAGSLSLQCVGRFLALIAHFFAPANACFLYSVLQGVAVAVVGHCADGYNLNFTIVCVLAGVSYGVLFVVSFLVTVCGGICQSATVPLIPSSLVYLSLALLACSIYFLLPSTAGHYYT
ncbi:uncharacterized protein [Triticum aestivum]|uniref:uncharacterized protein n=1 Tax=Triticum aestivum TaxID=4565 RepID=UPI001D00749E|nr:uncharacterized protein LOC123125784 [Triticum aestivum]